MCPRPPAPKARAVSGIVSVAPARDRAASAALLRGLRVAVDRDRLTRDGAAVRAGQEDDQLGDVLRVHELLDRLVVQRELGLLLQAASGEPGARREHVAHAFALDTARMDGIAGDAERTELERQRLGEADEAPLG